ncbi:MAG: protein translocase subunit SecD [Candidatus Pacebacteria bacterium]|nr:protein translocase subunit SecD [Candidatus Paceibacterota bacterium]
MNKKSNTKSLLWLLILTVIAGYIAFPKRLTIDTNFFSKKIQFEINKQAIDFYFWGKHIYKDFELKKGLDIQGGMQVVLRAKMDEIALEDRETALESAREIISRRVDLYGISEPTIQAARLEDDYRLIVELPGVEDPQQALELVGRTAELEFRLERELSEEELAEATQSANFLDLYFVSTGLTGQQLKKAQLQFDQQTAKPQIILEFNDEGRDLFAEITKNNIDKILAIFIDAYPVVTPSISSAILDGRAVMTGDFTVEEAKNLAIQLNAGALPVNIEVLEQKNIGASLGDESVQKSINAGLIGLSLVILFMILYYGWVGVISSIALLIYAILTIALYKIIGVVLTLPGIAGLILTIGMAVDANILIFERMKEEQRAGRSYAESIELGFGRAWDTVKDANLASIVSALVLINPLNFSFLNTSGLIKGFGVTFLLGSLLSMFTGVTVTRILVRQLVPIIKAKEFKS